jgi:hypothetical protein
VVPILRNRVNLIIY